MQPADQLAPGGRIAPVWASPPRRPAKRSFWSRAFWLYFALFVTGLYGEPVLETIRAATGSIPDHAAPAVIAWVVAWALLTAVAGGLAGGPWWLRRAVTTWVLPSRFGPAVLTRASVQLVTTAAVGGAVVGFILVLGFQRSGQPGSGHLLAAGALSGAALTVVGLASAMLVQPRRTAPATAAAGIGLITSAVVVLEFRSVGAAPALGAAAAGNEPPGSVLVLEVGLAILAAVLAVACTGAARMERIDARARALAPLSVVLFNRDVRSLRAMSHALSGEAPRSLPATRRRRPGSITSRYVHNLRRSPVRRGYRVAMLVAIVTWGWWLLSLGAALGTIPVAIGSWLIALEAAEPLGQELDRPTLVAATTVRHRLRHLSVASALSVPALLAPAVVLLPGIGAREVARAVLALAPATTIAAAAAAGHSLLRPESSLGPELLISPETFGTAVVLRELVPPALAVGGLLPLVGHERWAASTSAALRSGAVGLLASSLLVVGVIGVAWARERLSSRRPM